MEKIDELIAALLKTVPEAYADRTAHQDAFVHAVGLVQVMACDLHRLANAVETLAEVVYSEDGRPHLRTHNV